MELTIRPATAADADAAVPLVHSSGPAAFDYVFGDALGFLHMAFVDGRGEFGYRNHTVVVAHGRVVGVGAAYSGDRSLQFMMAAAGQIIRHHGPVGAGVITRGLRTERVIPPPKRGMQYIGHLGVVPEMRGRGVGTSLVKHFLAEGRSKGHRIAGLDVAVTNPRAQALYERLGFAVTDERPSNLANERAHVPAHRRMVVAL